MSLVRSSATATQRGDAALTVGPISVVAGDPLVLVATSAGYNRPTLTVSDTLGTPWIKLGQGNEDLLPLFVGIWYAVAAATGSLTATVTRPTLHTFAQAAALAAFIHPAAAATLDTAPALVQCVGPPYRTPATGPLASATDLIVGAFGLDEDDAGVLAALSPDDLVAAVADGYLFGTKVGAVLTARQATDAASVQVEITDPDTGRTVFAGAIAFIVPGVVGPGDVNGSAAVTQPSPQTVGAAGTVTSDGSPPTPPSSPSGERFADWYRGAPVIQTFPAGDFTLWRDP